MEYSNSISFVGDEEKAESEEDDDVEYFKEAVGENPDPGKFPAPNFDDYILDW